MTTFTLHTPASAPEPARGLMQEASRKFGFTPNLYGHLANAPVALEAYLKLATLFEASSFSPAERQVVLLAASVENGCEFCVAAHSMIARRMAKVPDAVVDGLREGGAVPDPRLDALAAFARAMVRERGWVSGAPLQAFLDAGFTQQQALEVVLGVAMKTLSNYANHLTGTQPNAELAGEAWHRAAHAPGV